MRSKVASCLVFSSLLATQSLFAAGLTVAVASNFASTAREIAVEFKAASGHEVMLAFGSTGKHYAQIRNGAPMDALLAADAWRPELLEDEGLAVADSRFTYAIGRLVLWGRRPDLAARGESALAGEEFRHLALANPKLAPYGTAAQQVLEGLELWGGLQDRIVRGENVGQALQYVDSGNAELGFIAASQLTPERRGEGSFWTIPQELYAPIEQQAVLLRDTPAGREFLAFLRSDESMEIIRSHGYETP